VRVLRGIFGLKKEQLTGEWTHLHGEKLHSSYSSPHIIAVIKSERMRWTGRVARMGEARNIFEVQVENLIGRVYVRNIDEDGRIILKWIFR
jgi:hypothetical protein